MRTDEQRRRAVEYLNNHPEQREKARARALEHIRRKRAVDPRTLRRLEVYRELAAEQGELCAICGVPPMATRRLSIDHCHTSDEIRGLLCSRCNMVLGYVADSVAILASMIAYLSRDAYTGLSFAEATNVPEEVA